VNHSGCLSLSFCKLRLMESQLAALCRPGCLFGKQDQLNAV
jgi:hypothetical protein